MSFNYPDFLGAGSTRTRQNSLAPNQGLGLDPRSTVFSQSLSPSDPPNNQNNPSNMNPNNVNPNNVNPNNVNNVNPNNMSNNVNLNNVNVPLNALNVPVSTLPVPLDPNAQNSHVSGYDLNHFSFNNLLSDNLLKLQKQDTLGPSSKVNASAFDPSNYDPTTYDSGYDSGSYDPGSLAPFNPSFSLEYAYNPSQSPHNLHTPLSSLHNSNLHKSPFGRLGADSFHLPRELQGGIGNISSRRPSYAAESFTRNSPGSPGPKYGPSGSSQKHSLATIAAANNYGLKSKKEFGGVGQLADSLDGLSLNANFSDFQARRPSQLAEYQPHSTQSPSSQDYGPYTMAPEPVSTLKKQPVPFEQSMKLENGLILRDQYILASVELKSLFLQASRYFQDVELSKTIVGNLHTLLASPVVGKLIHFIKNANNLTFNHKMLCLVINKNGKLDLLSYPSNSNIYLQNDDLVIVDGDRGKDLVMILEPLVQLDMAILFNFLKKIEHLKSLTILDPNSASSSVKNNHLGGIHSTTMDAAKILANHHLSNEDNEFIISLPTKQVLRFATPKEVQRLGAKFLEEKKAFLTCHNKIKELKLENDLNLINVEYQYDFKKLIFYYFAGFKRIDFRGLIKELFKIYKTRIWLCAVLPSDSPELYTCLPKTNKAKTPKKATDGIPPEYQLGNEQVVKFSLESFERIPQPNYFHSKNMANLVLNLMADVKGHFYGFGIKTPPGGSEPERRNSHSIVPSFDPFGDDRTLE